MVIIWKIWEVFDPSESSFLRYARDYNEDFKRKRNKNAHLHVEQQQQDIDLDIGVVDDY